MDQVPKVRLCEINYLTKSIMSLPNILLILLVFPVPREIPMGGSNFGPVDITDDEVYTSLFDLKANWYHLAPCRRSWDPSASPNLRSLLHPGGSGGEALKAENLAVERMAAVATWCISNGGYFSFLSFTGDYVWEFKPIIRLSSSFGVQKFLWSPCLTCLSNAPWFSSKSSSSILTPKIWRPKLADWLNGSLVPKNSEDVIIVQDNKIEKPMSDLNSFAPQGAKWNKLTLVPRSMVPAKTSWNKLTLVAAKSALRHKVSLRPKASGALKCSVHGPLSGESSRSVHSAPPRWTGERELLRAWPVLQRVALLRACFSPWFCSWIVGAGKIEPWPIRTRH